MQKKTSFQNLRYHKISQIVPNCRYVDVITTLIKIRIRNEYHNRLIIPSVASAGKMLKVRLIFVFEF